MHESVSNHRAARIAIVRFVVYLALLAIALAGWQLVAWLLLTVLDLGMPAAFIVSAGAGALVVLAGAVGSGR